MKTRRSLAGAIAMSAVLTAGAARADDWWGRDKALHFGASATLALGGYGAAALLSCSEPTRLLAGGGLALGLGVAKEVADRFTGGDPSWKDLGWDAVGTATGLLVAWSVDRLLFRTPSAPGERRACGGTASPDIRHPAVGSSAALWMVPSFPFGDARFRSAPVPASPGATLAVRL